MCIRDSFLAGKHDFGTLISLVIEDKLVAGVIDCPALSERWSSFQPDLTKVNNQPTICKSVEKLEDAVMATTSSHEFGMKKWRAYQSLEQSVKVTTTGSDCYNYGLLASGHIDIVAERLSFPHDYLPLIKIVEGAGGIMTDWEGKKLNFDNLAQLREVMLSSKNIFNFDENTYSTKPKITKKLRSLFIFLIN